MPDKHVMKKNANFRNNVKIKLSACKIKTKNMIDIFKFILPLRLHVKKNLFLIGTPDHSNIGDSAIAMAEIDFLKKSGVKEKFIKEITVDEYKKYGSYVAELINRFSRPVFLHGGGNMGNQWLIEELFRRKIIAELKGRTILVFPQTFWYSSDQEGVVELAKSKEYYNSNNMTIFAREQKSYDLILAAYPDANVCLCPDIVLSENAEDLPCPSDDRSGILFVMRNDGEKVLKDSEIAALVQHVSSKQLKFKKTDMHSDAAIAKSERKKTVFNKMREFASSEVVITDRLHAMIFCALTATPCIVLPNNNHKIIGTYQWIKEKNYIRFVNTANEVIPTLDLMLKDKISGDAFKSGNLFAGLKENVRATIG